MIQRMIDGKLHYGVGGAAKILGTSPRKINEYIVSGDLKASNLDRVNSSKLFVEAQSLAEFKYSDKWLAEKAPKTTSKPQGELF